MSTDPNNPCIGCAIVTGTHTPPGGVVWRGEGFVLHAVAGPSALPGWVVLTSERHVRALYELTEAEAASLGRLAARVMRAQRAVLGAEHAYAFAIGDVLQHCHLHLVPRYADTPAHLRGRGAFDARPHELRPAEELAQAAMALGAALTVSE